MILDLINETNWTRYLLYLAVISGQHTLHGPSVSYRQKLRRLENELFKTERSNSISNFEPDPCHEPGARQPHCQRNQKITLFCFGQSWPLCFLVFEVKFLIQDNGLFYRKGGGAGRYGSPAHTGDIGPHSQGAFARLSLVLSQITGPGYRLSPFL